MTVLIIDTAEDITAKLPAIKAAGVQTVYGYLSSINPTGAKCVTPARARAIAAAGLRLGLVHEGWGGVGGRGISAIDGVRDGNYCKKAAATLGAPKGACVYFACDTDFSSAQVNSMVLPYFEAIREAFEGSGYRVGVYGSGAVCAAVIGAKFADLSWEAQSRGWTGYSAWLNNAAMTQGPETHLDGIDIDTDAAPGDIGDFVPFAEPLAAAAPPPAALPVGATAEDYQIGAAALEKLVIADVAADIDQQVPSMFRGMIPANMAQQVAQQLGPPGAKAVIDAVDAARAARAK